MAGRRHTAEQTVAKQRRQVANAVRAIEMTKVTIIVFAMNKLANTEKAAVHN
jgi:hypothetical protein